jgi:phosphatidylglycerol:prolipoprotein diacylglycerol transferase
MIPYLEPPSWTVGPLTIHAFGVIVAASVVLGVELGRRRFRRLGLDPVTTEAFAWHVIVGGFLGAHLFAALLYFPDEAVRNPIMLLKFWENISSFGAMLGGLAAAWLYLRRSASALPAPTKWAYADVVAFVFPFALMVGRIACTLAHDHPGTITTFPLAVSLQTDAAREFITGVYQSAGRLADVPASDALAQLGFHDLGWYEFLYLAGVVVPVTVLVDRKNRAPGTFVMLFILLYMPVRFMLDSLRVVDIRYAGLTPAQWTAIAMVLALPVIRAKAHQSVLSKRR